MISVYKPVTDPVLTRTQTSHPRILASSRTSKIVELNILEPQTRKPANPPTIQPSNSNPPQALPDARRRSYPQDHKTTRPTTSSLRLLDATIASPASQPAWSNACVYGTTNEVTHDRSCCFCCFDDHAGVRTIRLIRVVQRAIHLTPYTLRLTPYTLHLTS